MKWFKSLQAKKQFKEEQTTSNASAGTQPTKVLKYQKNGPDIWAIGGGKGGVGKSMVAVNLAITLSKLGEKVLLIDADLGAANLHTFFGIGNSKTTLCRFLNGGTSDINNVISKTTVPNLELISGAKDPLDAADIKSGSIELLKNGIKNVDHDYVILDIGPGTATHIMELFLLANHGILITTPEPTSIENTYRFLKCIFLKKMRSAITGPEEKKLKALLHEVFSPKWSKRIKTFADIFTELRRLDRKESARLKALIEKIGVSILVNQTRSEEDEWLGSMISRGCLDYFDLEVKDLGYIRYDDSVRDSVRSQRPLTTHYSGSSAAVAFEDCVKRLMKNNKRTA